MECSLEELVRKLSALLKAHPNATICIERQRSDRLLVENGSKTFLDGNGNEIRGYEEVFFVTTDADKFVNDKDCVTIKEYK